MSAIPKKILAVQLRPASIDEAGLFYALKPEQDHALGCIGHVRMDFGSSGKEFWHSWHPRGDEALNNSAFKEELNAVVDELREGVLSSLSGMTHYCATHSGEIPGGWRQNYGYVLDTENYRYMLRCNPYRGEYQAYLTCFDKRAQELYQTQEAEQPEVEQRLELTMGGM